MKQRVVEFQIQDLLPIAMTFVVLGIGVAYGLSVMGDVQEDMGVSGCSGYWNTTSNVCQTNATSHAVLSGNSAQYNATSDAITGVAKIPAKMPLLVTIVIAVIIIGLLVTYLVMRNK